MPAKQLSVKLEDKLLWSNLIRIDKKTLSVVKFFKQHRDRMFAVLRDGRFIATGENSRGWLGLGHKRAVKTFGEIEALRNKSIQEIACGDGHTLVLTEDGKVFGWGRNDWGQLGLKDMGECLVPALIMEKRIVDIKCGNCHTIALEQAEENKWNVWAWGWNKFGQLGIGNTIHQSTPVMPVKLKTRQQPVIAAGPNHSFLLDTYGNIYGWGENRNYQLGMNSNHNMLRPVCFKMEKKTIKSIACNANFTLFLTADGLMYQTNEDSKSILQVSTSDNEPVTHITGLSFELDGQQFHRFVAFTSLGIYHWDDAQHKQILCRTNLPFPQIIPKFSRFVSIAQLLYIEQSQSSQTNERAAELVVIKEEEQEEIIEIVPEDHNYDIMQDEEDEQEESEHDRINTDYEEYFDDDLEEDQEEERVAHSARIQEPENSQEMQHVEPESNEEVQQEESERNEVIQQGEPESNEEMQQEEPERNEVIQQEELERNEVVQREPERNEVIQQEEPESNEVIQQEELERNEEVQQEPERNEVIQQEEPESNEEMQQENLESNKVIQQEEPKSSKRMRQEGPEHNVQMHQQEEIRVIEQNSEPLGQHILQAISNSYNSSEFCDIEFVFADNRSIKANRFILSNASKYMKNKLRTTWRSLSRVPILDSYPVFHRYLSYLYTHNLWPKDFGQLVSLSYLAHHNQELDLKKVCARLLFAQLNNDTCCQIYDLAVELHLKQLEEQASEVIFTNLAQVKLTEGFRNMNTENAKIVLDKYTSRKL